MPFLTIVVKALWSMISVFFLILLGCDFTGGSDGEDENLTGSNLKHGLNYMNGELDGGLDSDGSYR